MNQFLFNQYKFIYFLFKRFYYQNDEEECHRHTHVILSLIIISPLFGVLFLFGVDINLCNQCNQLTNKILLMPFGAIFLLAVYFYIKKFKFIKKIVDLESSGFTFNKFSTTKKISHLSLLVLMALSGLWLPILLWEIFG